MAFWRTKKVDGKPPPYESLCEPVLVEQPLPATRRVRVVREPSMVDVINAHEKVKEAYQRQGKELEASQKRVAELEELAARLKREVDDKEKASRKWEMGFYRLEAECARWRDASFELNVRFKKHVRYSSEDEWLGRTLRESLSKGLDVYAYRGHPYSGY